MVSAGVGGPGCLNRWNLVQHTDKNGMTHLEVESQLAPDTVPEAPKISDSNKGGILPKLPPIAPPAKHTAEASKIQQKSSGTKKSIFARELENILSKELESRPDKIPRPKKLNSAPGSELNSSLRQRAPALLLQKLDAFDDHNPRSSPATRQPAQPASQRQEEAEQLLWQKPKVRQNLTSLNEGLTFCSEIISLI